MRHRLAAICILTLGVFALSNCSSTGGAKPTRSRQSAALVTAAAAAQKSVPVDVRVVGTVEPAVTIHVRPQVSGELTKVYFKEGQDVKRGDPLFLIDPRPFDEAARQAEANLARDTALLRQAQANLKRDVAQEKYARDQAARYQKLFDEGIMAKEQAERLTSDADARTETIKADQAAIESAEAAVHADAATLANVRLQRNYCEISSPIDGRTGDLTVEEGNLVRATDSELVSINQIRPTYVTFSVPEKRLAEIKKYMGAGGLEVTAGPPGSTDPPEKGTLTFVNNSIDSSTGTIKLKGTFANPAGSLWPGEFVEVGLRLTTLQNAVVVPARAVQMGQDGEFVYVVGKDLTAEMRPVATTLKVGQDVVVASGVAEGETVVTEGQLRLSPGMTVRIKKDRMP
jgi:membrane fusion protein, multidrug efflux system